MYVTLEGILMEVKLRQRLKASSPITFKEEGKVIPINSVQSENV